MIKDAQKITSQEMCDKKNRSLQDRYKATARRVHLEQAISRVCSELPELLLQSLASFEEKVQQLVDALK